MPALRNIVGKLREKGDRLTQQIEFPLRVAVCAWCRPVKPRDNAEPISHGICPRHLREIELELSGVHPTPRSRRRKLPGPPYPEFSFVWALQNPLAS